MGVLIAHPRSGGRRRQQGMALIIVLMLFAIDCNSMVFPVLGGATISPR